MNKYLEKVAKNLTEEQIHNHGSRAFWKSTGGGLVGGMVPLPFASAAGSIAGRAHELAQMKQKITGKKVKMTEVAGDAGMGYLRSTGRGLLESVAGGAGSALLGAGLGAVAGGKNLAPAAAIAGGLGAIAGSIHGSWASSHNSTKDYAHDYAGEKRKK